MRHNVQNFLFFLAIAVGFYFLWSYAQENWFPKPQPKKKSDPPPTAEEKRLSLAAVAGGPTAAVEPKAAPKPPDPPKVAPAERPTLIRFGDENGYLRVLLTTRGGGVQQIVLTRFAEADRLGREVKNTPLYLIPGVSRPRPFYLSEEVPLPDLQPGKVPEGVELAEPSYTIFHYLNPDDKIPDTRLGDMNWSAADGYKDAQGNPQPKVLEGGAHEMVFEAELDTHHVKFRKTFTLAPKDYHVGLKVEIRRTGDAKGDAKIRYQITGARGLPIEGEWYTNMHRVALIGWNDRKGTPRRQYETASDVAIKRGGEPVPKGDNTFKYMAVATQYFASAVAIDDTADGSAKNPWAYVRATTEMPFDKKAGHDVPYFEDVTVRAASDVLDLAAPVTHSYVLYNGPAKVKLLGLMEGDRAVDQGLVDRYQDRLGLRTITDFHSPTWLGAFVSAIYWTDLVIAFTNLMHWLLAAIHSVVSDWALCIVVLTLIVRVILLYPSKKMTQMNMRMMEVQKKLAPQFEELKKKFEGDSGGYQRAKMKLMMDNGFNPIAPMGGCLLLLLQMPIMMGLYFCLQESVFFRLESFLWIDNLAAPDMTVWWTEELPLISDPGNRSGFWSFLYLGPYLNVLPIVAVVLMIGQQLAMLPPPTDEQSRQQRTMMKIMMFLMPVLFYKFAAGLALYFIIGSIWGLAERRLIPKPDLSGPTPGGSNGPNGPDGPEPEKPKGLFGRLKEAMKKRMEEMQRQADEQSRRQIRNKGETPDGQQGQGGQGSGQNQPRRDDRRDKKKKRRK